MRPRIICHMISTIDGKIDGAAFRKVTGANDYEKTAEELNSNAWICGRTTMQLHFADKDPFVSATNRAAGSQPVHVASQADSYAIVVDTTGRLRWSEDNIDGDHLICIVSEQATDDYLELLRSKGISYIVSGATAVDLLQAMDLLGLHFAVRNLLLEGGGHINGG
ncbi:MAG TPA: dihydrofolate reductase family protein, partial [Candidatus Rifleibacterium sp.]|nr:dihydrofolate reductase family protein [Candidatus Rifleibacterium sp.]